MPPTEGQPLNNASLHQFSTLTVILLMLAFYGGTYLLTLSIRKKKEDADAFMVSNHRVGFGIGAASMTATWIWAASFYAAATSGYTYGVSGPIHYGLWGALMILFIYPLRQALPPAGPQRPHPRRADPCPAWQLQPTDPGPVQRARQRDQPDGQLHRRRRPGLRALAGQR